MLSRKHYVMIANAIGRAYHEELSADDQVDRIVDELTYEFRGDNPDFRTHQFREAVNAACRGQVIRVGQTNFEQVIRPPKRGTPERRLLDAFKPPKGE